MIGYDHVRYAPLPAEVAMLKKGSYFCEVWQGLPRHARTHAPLPFIPSESTGGANGLKYECNGCKIWVTPQAAEALARDPCELLIATRVKPKKNEMHVRTVDTFVGRGTTFGDTLESAVQRAKEILNSGV